ncbi:MAG: monooxygenase, FAD-binding protein [Panacagrimonas sp.]|jgi:2-polyprenyl-6-methoxyphenol hydroxylase-like FAD-dependent oxidoreductase|nr:FAD-dependent monooxygenase [Panacagrimonas sp.]MCC2658227.1 monooxygenase, FAD-binding protein [Panacagrimonas sp.]
MSSNPGKRYRVGIVGGSIAGCATAIELLRLGCDVTLFERTGETLKDRGAGIGMPRSVVETLIARDLIDRDTAFFRSDVFTRLWRTASESRYGHLAWDQPIFLALVNWGQLYRNLRRRVPDPIYRLHRTVRRLVNEADRVVVELATGEREAFDFCVCADGYASLSGDALFPEAPAQYAGYVLWRGSLPESALGETAPLEGGVRSPGHAGGHGIFYFVPGADGSIEPGARLVNWGVYVKVPEAGLETLLVDAAGHRHAGSLPPGAMPRDTECALLDRVEGRLPEFYLEILRACRHTSVYAIQDREVPAYRKGRIAVAGDAGALARPHSASGALKAMTDALALSDALAAEPLDLDAALDRYSQSQTRSGNHLVRFGRQLGEALVTSIPDWSTMDVSAMERWFSSIVTLRPEMLGGSNSPR